jgi:hypothetical protein
MLHAVEGGRLGAVKDRNSNGTSRNQQQVGIPDGGALREYQELWFALAKRDWMSIVLVPVDPGASAADVGKSLADVGTRLGEVPVTAISLSSMGYESAFALADMQQHMLRERREVSEPLARRPVVTVPSSVVSTTPIEPGVTTVALAPLPIARVVITIPPVVSEPLGLACTQRADAVVLVIQMARSKMKDARRTIRLVGRDRIAGCFVVR